MIFEYETLKLIWLLLIGLLLVGFAVTGGFDLGVAASFFLIGKNDRDRQIAIAAIGPTWEGNQVWFITAGGAIFAAFPFLYAASFSSFYIAFLLILISLILRPPGIDYRSKLIYPVWRLAWDIALFISGAVPALLFGIAFGNLFLGIPFHYDNNLMPHPMGGFFALVNPYTLLFGLVSLSILVIHGALFLQLKTLTPLNERSLKITKIFGILFIISFTIAWLLTVFKIEGFQIISSLNPNESIIPTTKEVARIQGAWLMNYQKYPLGLIAPLLSVTGVILALVFSSYQYPFLALLCNGTAIASVIFTAGFTLFPFILVSSSQPNHSLTIWDASSSKITLTWMLWSTLILLPIVLSYTFWVYKIMRGKVRHEFLANNPY